MGPIFNHPYSAVGSVALASGTLNGLEVLTGKKQIGLVGLSLNYMVLHHFFKSLVLAENQGLLTASIAVIGGVSTLLEAVLCFPTDTTEKGEENPILKGCHSMNEMVILAAGVVIVVTAIFATDRNLKVQCVVATTLYGIRFATKFYREAAFINEMSQREESPSVVPEFLVDETAALKEKEIHYLVGKGEFEKLKRILSLDIQLNNPCLVGAPGSGKTELIRYFASEINLGRALGFEGWRVFSTTSTKLVEGTKFIGTLQEKIGIMFRYFQRLTEKGEKIVVFIDEIHQAVSTGRSTSSDTTSIAEALLTYMTNSSIRVVAATTYDNYEKLYQNPPFRDRFEKVMMPRMTESRRQRILEVHLNEIQVKYPGIELPKNIFERVQLVNRLKRENTLRRDIGLLYMTARSMHQTDRSVEEVLQEDLLEHIEGDLGMLADKGVLISDTFTENLTQAKSKLGLGFGGEQEIFSKVLSAFPQHGTINLDVVLERVVQGWFA